MSQVKTTGTDPKFSSRRFQRLRQWDEWLELPMVILGFVWLLLLVLELTTDLDPILETIGTIIWVLFVLEFALKLFLAPRKGTFLKANWLSTVALFLPALRIFRIATSLRFLRLASAGRGFRFVRLVTSFNRGMKSLGRTMSRHGFAYVAVLTAIVTLAGSAGMYAFENDQGLGNFPTALWWTIMIMTTMGSEYWPKTTEGRALCVFLALYAFSVFGYVTATLASYFIGRDAADPNADTAGVQDLQSMKDEIAQLREQIRSLEDILRKSLDKTP